MAARVGVCHLAANDLTDENKLALCNKVLHVLNEGLALCAQVFVGFVHKCCLIT